MRSLCWLNNISKAWTLVLGILMIQLPATALARVMEAVDLHAKTGSELALVFRFDKPTPPPQVFTTENPARIVLDFADVKSRLPDVAATQKIDVGAIRSLQVIESNERTRAVIKLDHGLDYDLEQDGRDLVLTLSAKRAARGHGFPGNHKRGVAEDTQRVVIEGIDFQRGTNDAGRLMVDLSNPAAKIDMRQEGDNIYVDVADATVSQQLLRSIDVTDFGTPVTTVTMKKTRSGIRATLKTVGYVDSLAYQTDGRFTVEARPLTEQERLNKEREGFSYTGDRLSLNFQDIDVRAALQLIADFTGLNMVASDSVSGGLSLRLQNVPWDQALDIILKTKGLDKRQFGNVLLVAPAEELATRERLDLEASQQAQELAPLRSEFIQVNYAKAADLAALMKDESNTLLSVRGSVSVDARTNTLLVQDTVDKLTEIRALVRRLDVPIKQVLIESRIVAADDDFERAMGIDFGLTGRVRDKPDLGLSGTRSSAIQIAQGNEPATQSDADRLNVSLPNDFSGTGTGRVGLALANLGHGILLDLELTALESEGLATVISTPRLITSNQTPAYIESGEEIPFQEATSSGATSTSFKKAVLRLEVTPQITPDEKINLDLTVNQDTKGDAVAGGGFAINTREIHTQVLVDNGETIVLGGIYNQTKTDNTTRIPYLGRLPWVGWLFSNDRKENKRSELIIFVTPKILQRYVDIGK